MFILCNNKRNMCDEIRSYLNEAQRNADTRIDDTDGRPDELCDLYTVAIGLERRAK